MACGVFHKASRGLWSKVKGVFGRIGNGIKSAVQKAVPIAKKVLKFGTGLAEKVAVPVGAAVSTIYTGDPTSGAKAGQVVGKIAGGINKFIGD